jgi:aspartate aminotransferase
VNGKNISLNMNVRGLKPSATLAINERSNAILREGRKVYKLGLGQSPFPVPEIVVNALRHHAHEKDYLPVKGLPELREAVADFHRRKDHVNASADGVLIGPGSKELMFLLQLVYYGEILLPTPCWVSYGPQAKIIGRNVKLIQTTYEERWRITADRMIDYLEKENDTYRPRLLILNYPGNPDGDTYSMEELQKIAEVAREYEIILLSDEIYGQLAHRGGHFSVARFYPEGTIISSGLSKWCGAGGWRLGTFTFPKQLSWLLDAMAAVASETFTSVSAPIQYAAVQAFRGGREIEEYLSHARRILHLLGTSCAEILQEAGIRVHLPNGAFYLFIDFSPHTMRLQ